MLTRFLFILLVSFSNLYSQFGSQDSGGKLTKEQACYDVTYYDLKVKIDPGTKSIAGSNIITAQATEQMENFVIDLDTTFVVESIEWKFPTLRGSIRFVHHFGKISITLPEHLNRGTKFGFEIKYAGAPRIAKRPPWDDGFVWKKSADSTDWITVTCQGGGGDVWFPCKDHPSDEPDSASLQFTAPEELVCIGSGRFLSQENDGNGFNTWHWFVSTPINNYNIMFYLGPYKKIEHDYASITGEKIPFTVWVLPESFEIAAVHSVQFVKHMRVMEELIGPYPFWADKYAVVESPHLGMEHQTAIAYGFGWKNHKDFEFDWLHHHEFSHEWWGNLVTAKDWSDFWIHEGAGTYMQPLYLEKVFGKEKYNQYMKSIKRFSNKQPVASRGEKTAGETYNLDVYYKGAWVIHTLRYYLGDEIFFKVLRRWAYPKAEMELITSGEQCRLATTDEFLEIAENVSGLKLDWFWNLYLRNAKLPRLNVRRSNGKAELHWETENNLPFFLPVEIKIDDQLFKIEMKNGKGEIDCPDGAALQIDPFDSILMEKSQS